MEESKLWSYFRQRLRLSVTC